MNIIDHGEWEVYTPSEYPPDLPKGVMFMRRKSDLVDWYKYIYRSVQTPSTILVTQNFGADTVKFTVMWKKEFDAYIVGQATRDVTAVVPHGHIVFEITDYAGDDPFKELNGKTYDPTTGAFTERVPVNPPETPLSQLQTKYDALAARLEKLEGVK